jgi:CubicO group peptidase (beta-lactamase class C family)
MSTHMHFIGSRLSRARSFGAMATIVCAALPSMARAQQAPDLGALDKYVARAARDWRIPGMAIAVVKDDSLVLAKGYGVLETGKPAPATEHTRFAIGSTTKAMTVAALAMLVDEGKLKWDDRVIDYFPDFQLYDAYVTRELTVRDLLTHRTGLPGTDLLWGLSENQYSLPEMMRRLRYVKPISSFRSHWEYQNVMYAIAGGLVAKISGMPWETFIRTRIFAPLGMNESIPLVSEVIGKPNVAVPHALVHDTVRVVPMRTTDAIAPAGSVYSSVSDMSKWMRFMLDSGRVGDKRLIKPETFREIIAPEIRAPESQYPALELAQPKFFSYALGWFVEVFNGETVWMHTGSIDGMCAIIALMPSRRVGVYVLENVDHAELRHALIYKVFDMYHPPAKGPARDWSADLKALFEAKHAAAQKAAAGAALGQKKEVPASLPLAEYAGTYVDSTYGKFEITLRDSTLSARFEKFDIGELVHTTYDSFRSRKDDPRERVTELTFVPDGTGHVASIQAFGETFVRTTTRSRPE